jgi:hypothetical protein
VGAGDGGAAPVSLPHRYRSAPGMLQARDRWGRQGLPFLQQFMSMEHEWDGKEGERSGSPCCAPPGLGAV